MTYWGTVEHGAPAFYRGHLYDLALRELGIECRYVGGLESKGAYINRNGKEVPIEDIPQDEYVEMVKAGDLRLDLEVDPEPLEWADVIVFRRYYNTSYRCVEPFCEFVTKDIPTARAHQHRIKMRSYGVPDIDNTTYTLWPLAAAQTDKAIIYETDDNLLIPQTMKWNGYWPEIEAEGDHIREMARRADLVTVSTPALAREMKRLNPRTVVIRNAINPDLYAPTNDPIESDLARVLYYGNVARMRDYAGYVEPGKFSGPRTWKFGGGAPAQAVEAQRGKFHRIFLGIDPDREDQAKAVGKYFDELLPYEQTIPGFCTALANARPDIGLAPSEEHVFNACKSELHWLEYSAVGAATIASRFFGDGPYNVIRHGVDGLLARGKQDWHDAVKAMLDPSRRADLAAAAKERVLAEYDYRVRAKEWADAFRWAAEHRGIGWKGETVPDLPQSA